MAETSAVDWRELAGVSLKNTMKLKQLKLRYYRCFREIKIDLDQSVIVMVAENGQGKSALLDAIRVGLWPFINAFDLARSTTYNDPANGIAISDVRMERSKDGSMVRQLPVEIELSADWGDSSLPMKMMPNTWTRYLESERPNTKTRNDDQAKSVVKHAATLQKMVRDPKTEPIDLPVFGYYGTGRLWTQKKLTETKSNKNDDTDGDDFDMRTFAYRNCMDPASSYKHFREWFIIAWRNRANMDYLSSPGEQEVRQSNERIEVVQEAINTFLKETTGWHSLEVTEAKQEAELFLNHPEQGKLNVDQLSDGIRGVLALVGDLAHRCVKLNRHLGNKAATDTSGVVLIDEVDMHLHPRWQQVVVAQLTDAFPNIQFIVTTHSPQVLTTVHSKSIRLIKKCYGSDAESPENGAETPAYQVKGTPSSDALIHLMGTNPQPDVEEARWVADYTAAIENGVHDAPDGRALRKKLLDFYGHQHPVILDADKLIRFQAFKLRRQKPKED